jgi:hypothetical protein
VKKGLVILGVVLLAGAAVAYLVLPQHLLPRKLQRPRLVSSPPEGSPEAVVMEVIKSCQGKDDEKGWQAFRSHLHPAELDSQASEKNWRTLNFPTICRKVHSGLFTPTDGEPAYELSYLELDGDRTKVFVTNEGNPENPTPCNLFKDAKTGDSYKIKFGCL